MTTASRTCTAMSLCLGAVFVIAESMSAVAAAPASSAPATSPAPAAKPGNSGSKGIADLGSSKEPIAIDADRLDVYDKDGRAVFTGNVVVVQGETTMKCTLMNVTYESNRAGQPGEGKPKPQTAGLGDDSSIKKMDCTGPVTITTKTQVATGDRAEFDKAQNKVFIIGNAVLNDGPNVVKGGKVAYDLTTSVAKVEGMAATDRVRTVIIPSSQKDGKPDGKPEAKSQKDAKPQDKDAKPRREARSDRDDKSDRDAKPKTR